MPEFSNSQGSRLGAASALLEPHLQAAVLQSFANAVLITDATGVVTWVNPAFARLTGYSAEECVGQHTRLLKSDRHDAAFFKHLWETILSGDRWRQEITNR